MPLPAFEPGGRRTSTTGSTMISINKRSPHIETCWEMAKNLYTSIEVAKDIYHGSGIPPLQAKLGSFLLSQA